METIKKAFELIGSRVVVTSLARRPVRRLMVGGRLRTVTPGSSTRVITVDVARDRKGEYFSIGLGPEVSTHVMNVDKALKHLLLFAVDGEGKKYRYLCGHDERHWFAAAVAGGVSSVGDAVESLKPEEVIEAQNGLRSKERNRRKNRATLRQGEWFFLPVPNLDPDPCLIIRSEPIRRGVGSPHFVEEVYRRGGVTVYVCQRYPNGVREKEYNRLIEQDPEKRFWGWQMMKRDMEVFGRGKVTHRDHETLLLTGWHRILVNTEAAAWFMAETLVFLD